MIAPLERVRDAVRRSARLDELDGLEDTVATLEVAVAENRELEVPLAALVDGLERDVAEVLSRRTRPGMGA
ncbi:MAG TPA: hypothetical protein VLK03_04300 [Nocardioides sp.]|nr:hypothetical protein [Nocardioides sp.]